jgi:hypothetical protein
MVKRRYMLAVMCGRSTYKLTWEEILRLYRLTLDAGAIHCSSAGLVREVLARLVCAMSVWNVGEPATPTNGHNALWIMLTPTSWGVGGGGRDRGRALMRREQPRFYSIHDNANMKLSTRLWKTSIGKA